MKKDEPRAHALLSASAAVKWLNCQPSARLEESFPDTTSEYAAEGILAHSIAELKARKHFIEGIGPRKFNSMLKKLKEDPLYQTEMDGYTDAYLEYLKECSMKYGSRPYVAIEKRVDYSNYAPEGFGTCDCIMIHADEMRIVDFKYGKGVPVNAEANPQLMLYALGAFSSYQILYPVKRVILSIFQPRLNSVSEWDLSIDDLLNWGENVVRPAALLAHAGEGEFNVGEHCRFCRVQAQCRVKAETMLSVFPVQEDPELLSDEEIGVVLQRAKELVSWCNAVSDYVLSAVLAGKEIPGWKAVEGRASRMFTDAEKAFNAITATGISEAMLYERKPLTLAQIEKLLGKKKFDTVVGDLVVKAPGKPTLAPEGDARPAIVKAVVKAVDEVFDNVM